MPNYKLKERYGLMKLLLHVTFLIFFFVILPLRIILEPDSNYHHHGNNKGKGHHKERPAKTKKGNALVSKQMEFRIKLQTTKKKQGISFSSN